MAALTGATLLSAAATHWLVLALAQTVAGIGAGVVLPSIYALATDHRPPRPGGGGCSGGCSTGWSRGAGAGGAGLGADRRPRRLARLVPGPGRAGRRGPGRQVACLPAGARRRPLERAGPLAPLAYPAVPALLLICLAFMAAFYGAYAFVGDALRTATGVSGRPARA